MTTEDLIIIGKDGRIGKAQASEPLDKTRPRQVLVQMSTGRQVWVPTDLLERRENGSYYLPVSFSQLEEQFEKGEMGEGGQVVVLPVVVEELDVRRRRATSGVRLTKKVHQREEVVDQTGFVEEVDVERVPVNLELQQPARVRYEGDTMIIPIMEEQLVVQKRLVLKEEVRITKRRQETGGPQRVTLRSAEAIVEPLEAVEETIDEGAAG